MVHNAQVFCLLLLASARADDGCDRGLWRCGDICVRDSAVCNCGNTTIANNNITWCCGKGCASDSDEWNSDATCPTGTVLPLTQTCHGICNHYPADPDRNIVGVRSHVPVLCDGLTRCQPEQICTKWGGADDRYCYLRAPSLCTGAPPVCRDGQDILTCWLGGNQTNCDMVHLVGSDSTFQCDRGPCVTNTIGAYDCWGREDEETLDNTSTGDGDETEKSSDQTPDLKHCISVGKYSDTPGVMCGGTCADLSVLCDPENRRKDKLSQGCQILYEVIRNSVCDNQTFISHSQKYYQPETKNHYTACGGTWPGQLVQYGTICDGVDHCHDGGDEICRDSGKSAYKYNFKRVDGYFKCADGKTKLGPKLLCDGIHQCNGEDKNEEDPYKCHKEYVQKGLAHELGNYQCVSADAHRHPNLHILAIRCNKKVECLKGEDELNCQDVSESDIFFGFITGLSSLPVFIFFGLAAFYIFCCKSKLAVEKFNVVQTKDESSIMELIGILLSPNPTLTNTNLMEFSGRYISSIFFHIMRMGYHQRKTAAKRFFDSISQNDDFMFWMKTNLHQVVSAFILLNSEQSVIDRRLPNWVKINLLGASGQFGQALKILITGFGAFSINLDLFFDCGLLLLLALMHSVALESGILLIFWLVMASLIFLPMLFNYCKLFEKTTKMQRLLLFCGFPIFPIVTQSSTIWLMYTKTKIQFEIDALTMYSGSLSNLAKQICRTADDLWEKIEKLDKVESVLTKQRLLETSAEGQPQSYIKLLLLFLTLSLTPNALIPETIFGKHLKIFGFPSELVLAAFILFPILKNVYFYLKLIDKKQTTTGSLLLICFIFFCLLGKVVSIVAVFSPPIGLFSILGHWKERQTPFSCEVMSPPNHDGFFYGAVQGEVTKTSWSTIGGTICKDGESYKNIASGEFTEWYPEDASVYFPLNLEATCLFVVAVAIVRLLFVYIAKLVICTDFRRKTPYTHISHIIHSNIGAVPLTYTHWEAASSLHGIRLMYTQEYREMTALLVINLFENILLLLPMMRTFFLIAERHSTLQNSIQVSCLEERSYQNALRLVVGSSIVVTGSFCFEIMLFTIYYRYAHIWKILLNQARLLDNEKIVMGEEFDPIGEKEFDCLVPDKEQPEHDLSKYVHDEKEDLVESPEEAVDPGHRVIIEMHEAKGADNPCFTEMDIVGHSSKEETVEKDMKQVEPSHSEEGAIRGIEEEERANPEEEEANLDILLA